MNKRELIDCFHDTLNLSNNNLLQETTERAKKSNKIYKENFVSNVKKRKLKADIIIEANTTFASAKKYCNLGKVAVLNFANPQTPGGGVQAGAMAQEECLCRSSNLFPCLNVPNVSGEFYEYHCHLKGCFYSDRLIYTSGVAVFKDDNIVPQLMPIHEWFNVDVITCAAPCLTNRIYTNPSTLTLLFKKRIKNIMEAAKDNHVDVIILGAFGCGAFKNPPQIVASAFRQIIDEENYFQNFKKIVFAIKPTSKHCKNLRAFLYQFDQYSPQEYQYTDKHSVKQFSILGDSISTLEGYNPKEYKVFYNNQNNEISDIKEPGNTWWGKVIDHFDGKLLMNNSYSGSMVTKLPGSEILFPSACSDERTSSLHIDSNIPDIIIIYLGINDWAFGAKTGKETHILGEDLYESFDYAYNYMLQKLKKNYPGSEIWCCTLCETYIQNNPEFVFPQKYAGKHIEEYNDIIRSISRMNNCMLADLHNYNIPYSSIDGIHPDKTGMDIIAAMIIKSMQETEKNVFQQSGYALPNPDKTKILYPDTLEITLDSTGETILIQKTVVRAGRDPACDLLFDSSHQAIARDQATFLYELETWFLIDSYSTNGTWINGSRIKPGKKYQLAANDIIDFAHSEKITFYRTDTTSPSKNDNPDDNYKAKLVDSVVGERYSVLKQIAQGYSKIYLVKDIRSQKTWAMKVFDKTSGIREAFLQEPCIMMRLNHPAIPRIIDIIENEKIICFIREYVEGESLENIVKVHGAQPIRKVIAWGQQLCDVLHYLHTLTPPHIYRDMKPSNIILMPDGGIKIIDFGCIHMYDPTKERDDICLGTRGYAAPEQFGGAQSDARTDIYGLGMTMYHLITGIDPKLSTYRSTSVYQGNSSIPSQFKFIITKCTQSDPDDRYQSCDELMSDLDNCLKFRV